MRVIVAVGVAVGVKFNNNSHPLSNLSMTPKTSSLTFAQFLSLNKKLKASTEDFPG